MAADPRTLIVLLGASLAVSGCGGSGPSGSSGGVVASARAAEAPATDREPRGVVVDVAGHVRHPGVYELPRGARVHEAIRAAGGVLRGAQLTQLNRAAEVVDGQQIVVPAQGQVSVERGGQPSRAGPVSLNTATADELDELPGIGPTTAERIVADRTSNGPFQSVADLDRVPGVGPGTLQQLDGLVGP